MKGINSKYAQNMARLSARIFCEPDPLLQKPAFKITRVLQSKPFYKRREFTEYYRPTQDITDLMSNLRNLGLYVDEHKDFQEEMERQRVLRGKGRKQNQ